MIQIFNTKKTIKISSILTGAADCHSHILPGVDDGIRTMEESLKALEMMEGYGISRLYLTPHIMELCPNTTGGLKGRFKELREAYKGYIRLHLAAEYMMDDVLSERLEKDDLLTLDGKSVLVETSTWSEPINMFDTLYEMKKKGYQPVLAHPERYRYMNSSDHDKLKRMGVMFQLNLVSLCGQYNPETTARAKELLSKGYYDCFGSDCHRSDVTARQYDNARVLDKNMIKALNEIRSRQTF